MRKAVLVVACVLAVACGGKSTTAGTAPSSATSPTATKSSAPSEAIDQSDYYAGTACKLHDDIDKSIASGTKPEDAALQAIAATGPAGNAADLNSKWNDLKAALDAWEKAIPDAAKRSEADVAVKAQCQKVPASIRGAESILPS
jgi:hypothetical protein